MLRCEIIVPHATARRYVGLQPFKRTNPFVEVVVVSNTPPQCAHTPSRWPSVCSVRGLEQARGPQCRLRERASRDAEAPEGAGRSGDQGRVVGGTIGPGFFGAPAFWCCECCEKT